MSTHRSASVLWSLLATTLVCAVTLLAARTLRAEPAAAAKNGSYHHVPVSLWLIPQVSTSGLANERMETNLALSLGFSGYARLRGFDAGVGGSWVTESMAGAQATVGFNYAGRDARGAQLTVGVNLAPGRMTGLQVSSGVNFAGALSGAQVGLVNYGSAVTGAQIGLLNIGRKVRGAQIGLLNLSEDVDAPIGLLNLVKNGRHHVELWGSDSAPLNLGFKLGSRYIYTLAAVGFQPQGEIQRWMVGLGVGGHIPITSRIYIETDGVAWQINEDEAWTDELNMLFKLRVICGYRFHDHFSVFAGPTLNTFVTRVDDGSDFGLISGYKLTSDDRETTVRMWPGFVAGFRI